MATKAVGITRVKDEVDVIETVVTHMLHQVDIVIVQDNNSSDGTADILRSMRARNRRLVILPNDERVAYYQSKYMTELAAYAHKEYAADWVVPFDADELWFPRELSWGAITDVLSSLPDDEAVASATLLNHVATGVDVPRKSPMHSMEWRRKDENPMLKVACRAVMPVTIEMGNHDAHYGVPTPTPIFTVHHFPYRSVEQMIRKTRNGGAAYAAARDLDENLGKHWRDHNRLTDEQIGEAFRQWYWTVDPQLDLNLVHDPAPLPKHS